MWTLDFISYNVNQVSISVLLCIQCIPWYCISVLLCISVYCLIQNIEFSHLLTFYKSRINLWGKYGVDIFEKMIKLFVS